MKKQPWQCAWLPGLKGEEAVILIKNFSAISLPGETQIFVLESASPPANSPSINDNIR